VQPDEMVDANKLLTRLREVLQPRFGFADVVWRHKFIYTRVAEPEVLEDLAARSQFVITAIGD
jgi:hypothetical protein